MANIKSEQLRSDLSLDLDFDQPLSNKELIKKIIYVLGKDNCRVEKILGKNILIYEHDEKKEYLLLAAITYMGGNGQHPIYKKRMQLKKWYKDIFEYCKDDKNINIRFIGGYHYQNNIILAEFIKDSYITKKMNSSAAHIYTNDLYQAMKEGFFKRVDKNKNEIIAIKYIKFKDYLDGNISITNELFTLFNLFNTNFDFGKWLPASQTIPEMYTNNWTHWKQGEWPGWYLEYRFDSFIQEYAIENKIKYVGSMNKKDTDLDFDLWFDEDNFFGDLKASDITSKEAIGNDQETFIECINKYDKFWYVIYEHETIKDSDTEDFEATRFRTNFIKDNNEWDKGKVWDELSYHKRMKHSVKFIKMFIIELNRINFRDALNDFNQGKQPDGSARKPKFKITKNNIDNFIVFQHEFIEIEKNDF